MKVAVMVGSLRKESFSRKTAKTLIAFETESLMLDIVEIGNLQVYNQDYDDDGKPPIEWTTLMLKGRFRIKVHASFCKSL